MVFFSLYTVQWNMISLNTRNHCKESIAVLLMRGYFWSIIQSQREAVCLNLVWQAGQSRLNGAISLNTISEDTCDWFLYMHSKQLVAVLHLTFRQCNDFLFSLSESTFVVKHVHSRQWIVAFSFNPSYQQHPGSSMGPSLQLSQNQWNSKKLVTKQ